jgi:hypothetical protein
MLRRACLPIAIISMPYFSTISEKIGWNARAASARTQPFLAVLPRLAQQRFTLITQHKDASFAGNYVTETQFGGQIADRSLRREAASRVSLTRSPFRPCFPDAVESASGGWGGCILRCLQRQPAIIESQALDQCRSRT